MPKERITGTIEYAEGSVLHENRAEATEVSWGRGRYVQLATVHGDDGLYVDLDRAGINRLIRSLRKARDQAYGADA